MTEVKTTKMHDYKTAFIALALEVGALRFGEFTLKSDRKSTRLNSSHT